MSYESTEAFDDLEPGEVERRMTQFAESWDETHRREMSDKEFHGVLACWTHDYVRIDAMGKDHFSEKFLLAGSILQDLQAM